MKSHGKCSSFPGVVSVHLVEKCNFSCPKCHTTFTRGPYTHEGNELAFEYVERLAKEAAPHRPRVRLHGGEPLLYRRLPEAIHLMAAADIPCSVTTNGLLLKERAVEMVENGLTYLIVSLDGWDAQSQSRRGGLDSFEAILEGLRIVQGFGDRAPIVKVNTLVTDVNFANLVDMYHLVHRYGIRHWRLVNLSFVTQMVQRQSEQFYLETGVGRSLAGARINLEHYFSPGDLERLRDQIDTIRSLNDGTMDIEYRNFDLDLKDYYSEKTAAPGSFCSAVDAIEIRGNGELSICTSGYPLGHLRTSTIQEAWLSTRRLQFQQLYEASFPFPPCYRCCALHARF